MVKLRCAGRGVRVPSRTGGETVVAIGNLGMEAHSMNETTGACRDDAKSPLFGLLNIQDKRITELAEQVTMLTHRLDPLCLSCPPGLDSPKAGIQEATSEVQSKLMAANRRLETIIESLKSVLGRLQV